jgi:hypothetical protein
MFGSPRKPQTDHGNGPPTKRDTCSSVSPPSVGLMGMPGPAGSSSPTVPPHGCVYVLFVGEGKFWVADLFTVGDSNPRNESFFSSLLEDSLPITNWMLLLDALY